MFKNFYLFKSRFIKRCKKFKAPAMKKRPHLRAKIQRVLTMTLDSVGTATSNLIYSSIKSLVLDTMINKILLSIYYAKKLCMHAFFRFFKIKTINLTMLLDDYLIKNKRQNHKVIGTVSVFIRSVLNSTICYLTPTSKETKGTIMSKQKISTMFIFSYFYFFHVINSLNLVIMFIFVSNKKVDLQLASQLLDDVEVDNFFLLPLERKFGKTLGIYLTKYLIFWQKVKNPFGRYFLDYSFDPENRSVAFWGSPFNHKELLQMNDLPKDREKVAIIHFLGQKIRFQKINHLFSFLSLLQNAVRQNLLRSEPALDYNIKTLKSFFSFANFPTYPVELIQYNQESGQEVGLLHIDFENTFNFSDFISKDKETTKQKVLEDFLFFLEILEIKIDYDGENLLRFIKNLEDIRLELVLENQTVDISRKAENNHNIYYIDQFLDIFNQKTRFKIKKNIFFSKIRQTFFIPKVVKFLKKLLVEKVVFFFVYLSFYLFYM